MSSIIKNTTKYEIEKHSAKEVNSKANIDCSILGQTTEDKNVQIQECKQNVNIVITSVRKL